MCCSVAKLYPTLCNPRTGGEGESVEAGSAGGLGVGFRLGWREELEWIEGLSSISADGEMGADGDVSR